MGGIDRHPAGTNSDGYFCCRQTYVSALSAARRIWSQQIDG